jgi:hypothetical protein
MVPVKNRDLWQRIDRALHFHQVQCRSWRFDLPHSGPAMARTEQNDSAAAAQSTEGSPLPARRWRIARRARRLSLMGKRLAAQTSERFWLAVGRLGTGLVPIPWLE